MPPAGRGAYQTVHSTWLSLVPKGQRIPVSLGTNAARVLPSKDLFTVAVKRSYFRRRVGNTANWTRYEQAVNALGILRD